VFGKPLDASGHDFLRRAGAMTPDGKPRERRWSRRLNSEGGKLTLKKRAETHRWESWLEGPPQKKK
jgi:hypothetical protein